MILAPKDFTGELEGVQVKQWVVIRGITMATTFNGIHFIPAAGNANNEGIFIPVSQLPGVTASELADSEPGHLKYSKVIKGICEQLVEAINRPSFEGRVTFSATKSTPTGVTTNQISQVFSFSFTKVLNLQNGLLVEIPEPTTGTQAGKGSVDVTDIFAGAIKVGNDTAVEGAGVVIPTSLLTRYSNFTHSGLTINGNTDNRSVISALMMYLGNDAILRSATEASAITGKSVQGVPSISGIPANFTALPNPLSGISPNELLMRALITRTVSITINFVINWTTEALDVNSVTA